MKLLDCTLRDGGYVNDWRFGKEVINDVLEKLINSGTDIVELGFLRNAVFDADRAVFPSMETVRPLLKGKSRNCLYAVMAEVSNKIDVSKLEEHTPEDVDLVRVIIWKTMHDENGIEHDALQDGFEYCKSISEKGYRLCIQPARTEQYSDDEFKAMLLKYSELNPYAIYVVDSWGTMYTDEVLHYVRIADELLSDGICIGYHGHNNMMQAFSTAEALTKEELRHELILDSSVYGIGRGAGNLNTELIAKYLNHYLGTDYDVKEFISIYENEIKAIYNVSPWGYSVPFLISATHHANPNYAMFFDREAKMDAEKMDRILLSMSSEDKTIYKREKVEKYLI